MKETQFKINTKKRNLIIIGLLIILAIVGVVTVVILNRANNNSGAEPTISSNAQPAETEKSSSTEEPQITPTIALTETVTSTAAPTSTSMETATPTVAATPTPTATTSVTSTPTQTPHMHSYTSSVTTQPTCENNGVNTFTCSCGDSYTESIPAIGHTWASATCTSPKTCTTCGATEGATIGHSYNEVVTTQPTCTSDGVKTFTCSCGHSYTEAIPALGHNYQDHEETIHHPGESRCLEHCYDCDFFGTSSEVGDHLYETGHTGSYSDPITTPGWDEIIHNWICSRCGEAR